MDSWKQISLAKGAQRYVFRYCPGREADVLESFRALAGNPDSGFDWFDAAVLSYKLAKRVEQTIELVTPRPPTKAAG